VGTLELLFDVRAVRLTGEAFFTVAHTDGTPFTVVSGSQETRVLGTSFLVRHYADETRAIVAVRDGRVAVHATEGKRATAVLGAQQQTVVSATGSPVVTAADPTQFSFVNGVLEFNNVSLRDAIPSLDRWYDVSIVLADPALGGRLIMGGFRSGSITDLVGTLELLFDVRAVRDGNTVTLYPK